MNLDLVYSALQKQRHSLQQKPSIITGFSPRKSS